MEYKDDLTCFESFTDFCASPIIEKITRNQNYIKMTFVAFQCTYFADYF